MAYTEEEFKILLNVLAEDLLNANHHYRLYTKLQESVKTYNYEINAYIGFWDLTFNAHRKICLLLLCRAYDTRPKGDTLSLKTLLDIIQGNPAIFDIDRFRERLKHNPYVNSLAQYDRSPNNEQLQKDIEFVSNTNPIVKKLSVLRGSNIAHISIKNVLQDKDDIDLTWSEVKELIDKGLEIFNRYHNLFEASTYPQTLIGEDDYKNVLKHIRIGIKAIRFINEVQYQPSYYNTGVLDPHLTISHVDSFLKNVQDDLYFNG